MAILDNTDIIFLYRQEVHRFLKYDLRAGSRLPSHCTASGKVLLASLDDQELKQRIRKMKLEGTTSHTITDRKKLYQEILKTRANGIGTCDRELSLALYSISTPLLNHEKKVVAAINLSLSSEEATGTVLADAKREIVEQGRNLSKLLGYEGDYPLIIP